MTDTPSLLFHRRPQRQPVSPRADAKNDTVLGGFAAHRRNQKRASVHLCVSVQAPRFVSPLIILCWRFDTVTAAALWLRRFGCLLSQPPHLPLLPYCGLQLSAAESPWFGSAGRCLVLSSSPRRRRCPAQRSSGQSVSLSEPTRNLHCMSARKVEPCHRPAPPFFMPFT